jgi:hypothetical protein
MKERRGETEDRRRGTWNEGERRCEMEMREEGEGRRKKGI